MRRNAEILLGVPLLLLSLALSAPGVEIAPGCDPRVQSCEAASAGEPANPAACEARPHEVDVRRTQAAMRRLRQDLAGKLAQADTPFVLLNGMGHNYRAQEFPRPAQPAHPAPKPD